MNDLSIIVRITGQEFADAQSADAAASLVQPFTKSLWNIFIL